MTTIVSRLSGGNQQKVLLEVALRPPRVLLLDEPTRGVDVGAKRALYELIVSLAASGMGVLLISSEIEEILGLAHRVLVMRRGLIVAEFAEDELDEERSCGRRSAPSRLQHCKCKGRRGVWRLNLWPSLPSASD